MLLIQRKGNSEAYKVEAVQVVAKTEDQFQQEGKYTIDKSLNKGNS